MSDAPTANSAMAPSESSLSVCGRLFITGCERTGTTALLNLLNGDGRIVLGRERFKFICNELSEDHFRREHFFQPKKEETNFRNKSYYEKLAERWDTGSVKWFGDKNPLYFRHLDHLSETFPDAKFIFTFRGLERVADSYNRRARDPYDAYWPARKDYNMAVEFWNESLSQARRFWLREGDSRIFLVVYERFFSGSLHYLQALYDYLELPLRQKAIERFSTLTADWSKRQAAPLRLSQAEVNHLNQHADRELERWILGKCPI